MTNLSRITAKIFGETATTTGEDPEIGQFGSALAGTYVGTGDVATIQSLPAWSNGFIDSVTPSTQFPPLPEMTGFGKVLSYQTAYTMQKGVPEWDANTTYYTGDFCKGVGEGKLYVSLIDNNLNHAVSDTAYWEEFSSGAFRNIGEIVSSTIPLTDAGLHLLDGALISGSGSYSAFVDYIADLYGDGTNIPSYFCTEAQWQTAVTTYGVCGKFVYDSANNTVRLPKYSNKIYTKDLVSTAPVIGNGMTLGLTNGNSLLGVNAGSTGNRVAIFNNNTYGTPIGTVNSNYSSQTPDSSVGITTDGSKSGIIADLANITTSLDGYYYIVVATSTKTSIEVDIDEIATDLNGKADVDLTNCTDAADIKMAHNAMPSDTYIDLTLGASGTEYVAPADGWYFFRKVSSGNTQNVTLINVTQLHSTSNPLQTTDCMGTRSISSGNSQALMVYLPVKKGDIVAVAYSAGGVLDAFKFIYAVGSESEAQ